MKKVLGLDLGTNSIGWALVEQDFENKKGNILGAGSRIIPMSQDVLGKFDSGVSISQTAERTGYRGTRRLYQRANLRRERLHRVLNILEFLPKHYSNNIDFEKRVGQFIKETKLNYKKVENVNGYQFLFEDSFIEMVNDFRQKGYKGNIPKDWTIYFLRKKALHTKISKYELAWILLNFNQKRGYFQLRGEEENDLKNKQFVQLKVTKLLSTGEQVEGKPLYKVFFENEWEYDRLITKKEDWENKIKEFIVTISTLKNGETKYSYKAVDSENDWPAIKAKTENDIIASGLSIGQYIYDNLLDNSNDSNVQARKIRGKFIKTIERKFYKDELLKILSEQKKHHAELQDGDLYKKAIHNLYSKNDAHRNNIKEKDFTYLLLDDILFYQRPLKSKKSTISDCRFEYRQYKTIDTKTKKEEIVKSNLKAAPKSHPLYQEFR